MSLRKKKWQVFGPFKNQCIVFFTAIINDVKFWHLVSQEYVVSTLHNL